MKRSLLSFTTLFLLSFSWATCAAGYKQIVILHSNCMTEASVSYCANVGFTVNDQTYWVGNGTGTLSQPFSNAPLQFKLTADVNASEGGAVRYDESCYPFFHYTNTTPSADGALFLEVKNRTLKKDTNLTTEFYDCLMKFEQPGA